MTDRTTLEALLARVLEGEGPDRELDGQIALLKGYTYEKRKGDKFAWWHRPDGFRVSIWGDQNKPPPYTASLDAALTLVPEGYEWLRKTERTMTVYRVPADPKEWARHIDIHAATPARALIAACLKARMEAQGA